jgi:hypothetical protein
MSDTEAEHEAWLRERCPNDAGQDHAWGWINSKDSEGIITGRNIFWLHRCTRGLVLGTINVTKPIHTLVSEDPLHVEPSILCSECGDHGHLREGRWV